MKRIIFLFIFPLLINAQMKKGYEKMSLSDMECVVERFVLKEIKSDTLYFEELELKPFIMDKDFSALVQEGKILSSTDSPVSDISLPALIEIKFLVKKYIGEKSDPKKDIKIIYIKIIKEFSK